MSNTQKVARAAAMVMIMIFLSRVLGYFRTMVAAHYFGAVERDAYTAAFNVPDLMFFILAAGGMSAAFIPAFSGYLAKDREEEGWQLVNTYFNTVVIAVSSITLLGIIFAPWIAHLVGYSFRGEKLALLIRLIRIIFPTVSFTVLAGITAGILNSYQKFFSAAFGPIVYNLGIIFGAVFLGKYFGIEGMAYGTVIGAIGNFLVQFINLYPKRSFYHFKINWRNPEMLNIVKLMIPTMIGLSITQVNVIVNQSLASSLPDGTVADMSYANILAQAPLGIFAMGITTVVFPTLARLFAQNEMEKFKETLSMGIRTILFVTIPTAVGISVLSVPIVRFLYETGKFRPIDTIITSETMVYYCIGIFAYSAIQITTRAFYSAKDTRTPLYTGVIGFILNLTLNLLFLHFTNLAHKGLALTNSVVGILNMLLLFHLIQKKTGGIGIKRIVFSFLKTTAASLVMGGVIYTVVYYLSGIFVHLGKRHLAAVQIGVGMLVGTVVFAIIAIVLKMEETETVKTMFRRKFRKQQS